MITNNKLLFGFILIFFTLFTFPFPLNFIPKLYFIEEFLYDIYYIVIPWIGEHILQIEEEITQFNTGSGDTTFNYVLLLFFAVVAITGAMIWRLAEKRNTIHEKLNYWFLVLLRFYLAEGMISYGMYKVIPLQFSEPDFSTLLQPYGESSPMGLAWNFLGFSSGYNLFMGLGEVIGGILLFHRRTMLLGGLILIPVTANVVAVNFFYDVPVKLFSFGYLLMAIIIILPDTRRLFNVILFNRPTKAIEFKEPFTSKKWLLGKSILKWVFVFYFLYYNIDDALVYNEEFGPNSPKPELYGLYETTSFVKNNDTIPPLLTDVDRWRYLVIEYIDEVGIYKMDMSPEWYQSNIDTLEHKLVFTSYEDSTQVYSFNYRKNDSTLYLNGLFKNDTISFTSKRKDREDFLLISRGFHWINEYPFNR